MGVIDDLAAYQLDAAVIWLGIFIENRLHETVRVGSGPTGRLEPKYTIDQLLGDDPFPHSELETLRGVDGIVWD